MDHRPSIDLIESSHAFPGVYRIKAIGAAEGDFDPLCARLGPILVFGRSDDVEGDFDAFGVFGFGTRHLDGVDEFVGGGGRIGKDRIIREHGVGALERGIAPFERVGELFEFVEIEAVGQLERHID